ncbi:(2Fe-2S)-binding protein [Sulfidibacter corallicola]|uniref:(2Fe-2S)-binding protein n=1 Tax=Sulfidibacter corallicola TaxID=2818388 RepID=A0A8A4TDY1_SULCO|nr:2Fe-2S iron-sulfur cluster-binding protein [Sulfidibacter corallicola]QTD47767.1 (2Fe-2S)-binding protein [Sulfidibacter corallicola]
MKGIERATGTKTFEVRFSGSDVPSMEVAAGLPLDRVLTDDLDPIPFGCRTGVCGTCLCEVTEVRDGVLSPPDEREQELLAFYAPGNATARLACRLTVTANLKLKPLH